MTRASNRLEVACRGKDWLESPRFQCLGYDFSVRTNDPPLLHDVCRLYEPCATSGLPRHRFLIRRRVATPLAATTLYVDGDAVARNVSSALAIARLVWEINQRVVAGTKSRLLLHAAAAERDGSIALLPGPPGAGKSTLVAALVESGLRYVTDEAVAIDPSTTAIDPYPKPIALDRGGPVLARLGAPISPALGSEIEQQFVPPRAIRADAVAPPGGLARLVLLVGHRPDRQTAVRPLARAEAVIALAEQSFNFQTLGPGSLGLVADVVRACRCYRLDVNDLDDACRLVLDLLSAHGDPKVQSG